MLRITDLAGESDRLLLRVEGRLIGPWVTVLRRHCRKRLEQGAVDLDLNSVSFVDPAGLALLRDLVGRGVRLKACSSFVSELLNQKASQ